MRQILTLATSGPGWRDAGPHRGMSTPPAVVELLDELLEASADTVELAPETDDLVWLVHLDYLRALQRLGHATLARLS